jgi:hypothetical protein
MMSGDHMHGHIHAVRPNRAKKYEYPRSDTTLLRGTPPDFSPHALYPKE